MTTLKRIVSGCLKIESVLALEMPPMTPRLKALELVACHKIAVTSRLLRQRATTSGYQAATVGCVFVFRRRRL
jgi:hypothetical protein